MNKESQAEIIENDIYSQEHKTVLKIKGNAIFGNHSDYQMSVLSKNEYEFKFNSNLLPFNGLEKKLVSFEVGLNNQNEVSTQNRLLSSNRLHASKISNVTNELKVIKPEIKKRKQIMGKPIISINLPNMEILYLSALEREINKRRNETIIKDLIENLHKFKENEINIYFSAGNGNLIYFNYSNEEVNVILFSSDVKGVLQSSATSLDNKNYFMKYINKEVSWGTRLLILKKMSSFTINYKIYTDYLFIGFYLID